MTNREIDIKIAEQVYGAKVTFLNERAGWRRDYRADNEECNDFIATDNYFEPGSIKTWSSDIKLAFELIDYVSKAYDPHGRVVRPSIEHGGPGYKWNCDFRLCHSNAGDDQTYWRASGDTPSEAICNCILKMYEDSNG